MEFFQFLGRLIVNYTHPFKLLSTLNEEVKLGFGKRRVFYYTIIIYIMGLSTVILSNGFYGGIVITTPGFFIFSLLTNLIIEFGFILLIFSFSHLIRIKIEFDDFAILYLSSNYLFIILLPLSLILYPLPKEIYRQVLNVLLTVSSIIVFFMKIKAFSLVSRKGKEFSFLCYLFIYLLVFLFVILILSYSLISLFQYFI